MQVEGVNNLRYQNTYAVKLSTGHYLITKKATDIVKNLLADVKASECFCHKWSYNDGKIRDGWNTDGWLDYMAYFHRHIKNGYVNIVSTFSV